MTNIAIIGGGPAGFAAAIYAKLVGLSVTLIHHEEASHLELPEFLLPGVEIIFRQLGVWQAITALPSIRPMGHYTLNENQSDKMFHPYSNDRINPWHGLQMTKKILCEILKKRAEELGVTFVHDRVKKLIIKKDKMFLALMNHAMIEANYYLDASGSAHLFARQLSIDILFYSPQLIAKYGYLTEKCPYDTLPIFIQGRDTWTWYSQMTQDRYAWITVEKREKREKENIKTKKIHKISGGADVTWRLVQQLAGPQFFLIGDAACVLDPSSGQGILRALMSGMMAVHAIVAIQSGKISPQTAYEQYSAWLKTWFQYTVKELQQRLAISI